MQTPTQMPIELKPIRRIIAGKAWSRLIKATLLQPKSNVNRQLGAFRTLAPGRGSQSGNIQRDEKGWAEKGIRLLIRIIYEIQEMRIFGPSDWASLDDTSDESNRRLAMYVIMACG